MKTLWYFLFKLFLKTSLFFYSKKIKVIGSNNIPKKGAVLFMANHPNGLIDPLYITTNNSRTNHFLVRAAVFKKPIVKWFLSTLNLMPIYRIRDGASNLGKNIEIFENCFHIFKKQGTILIFPEGSHNRKRTIRPLSKGFTRIVFGALEKYPDLKITIIPVGLTYQNASSYPCKVCINYGKPILANSFIDKNELTIATVKLKNEVSFQLKKLTVHIPDDENYTTTLHKLNDAQVDFTEVKKVNTLIHKNIFSSKRQSKKNSLQPLFFLIIINNILPYLIWKKASKKIDEIEFIDTFRFAINAFIVPIFLGLQTWLVTFFFCWKIGLTYLVTSLLLLLFYAKFSPTNTENFNTTT